MKHRFFNEIRKLQNHGYNQFFLYGYHISDVFYNQMIGSVSLRETLAFQMLYHTNHKRSTDFVLVWGKKGVTVYEKGTDTLLSQSILTLEELRNRFLGFTEKENVLAGHEQQGEESETENIRERINTENRSQYNSLLLVMEILEKAKQRFGLIIEDLKWTARLFEGKDHQLQYLEKIEEIKNISKNHVSFIIVDCLEIISNYFETLKDKDDKSAIYVGSPGIGEIALAYARGESYQRLSKSHFRKIATIVKNSGKHNLDSAINAFVNIKRDLGQDFYDPEKLIPEFEKVLESPIESISWDQVYVDEAKKLKIQEIIKSFLNGTNKKKGILLWGPPGTGKTTIAKAIANEAGLAFLAPKLGDIKGEFLGHSARNMRNLFLEARTIISAIFFDEIDGLLRKHNNDSYGDEMLKQFLAEVDGVDTARQKIFVIGATNYPDVIDDAVRSRFELIEIPLPSGENRRRIFQAQLDLSSLPENHRISTFDRLARMTEGFSGRDVKGVCGDIEQKLTRDISLDVAIRESFLSVKNNLLRNLNQHEIIPYSPNEHLSLENVVYASARHELERFVRIYPKNPELVKNGLRVWNGVFFFGREGNGQRFISKVLANVLEHDLIVVSGLKAANISEIFQQVIKISLFNGIVLLFEGLNSIVQSGQFMDFLSWLQKVREESHSVVFIVALQDAGPMELDDFEKKFDTCIELEDPNQEEKKMLVQHFFGHPSVTFEMDFPLDIAVDYIDQKYSQPSISDIKTFCDKVKRDAFVDQSKSTVEITEEYFQRALSM